MIGLAVVLGTSTAFAQEQFSDQGTLAFSADRLFGMYLTQRHVDPDGPGDWDDDEFEFGFLWQDGGTTPYTTARGAIDYFIIDHLSLGGTVAYNSVSDDDDDDFDFDGDDDYSAFIFGPRVGGAWMFTDWFGIWPRGGLSYFSAGFGDNDYDYDQLSLTLEAALIFSPTENFAFTVGPAFDIGLTGDYDGPGPNNDGDYRMNAFGIAVGGLMGWVNL